MTTYVNKRQSITHEHFKIIENKVLRCRFWIFNFYRDLQGELSNYPWLEMLVSLTLLILFAALANFIAKRIIVRGIRHLVTKIKSLNQSVLPSIVSLSDLPILCRPLLL